MLAEYLASAGAGGTHLIATVLFMLVFVAVVAYTMLDGGAKRGMDRAALLPFEDGEQADAVGGKQGDGS
jgi:cbb3-type cytochrome oxidase subunit 3